MRKVSHMSKTAHLSTWMTSDLIRAVPPTASRMWDVSVFLHKFLLFGKAGKEEDREKAKKRGKGKQYLF